MPLGNVNSTFGGVFGTGIVTPIVCSAQSLQAPYSSLTARRTV